MSIFLPQNVEATTETTKRVAAGLLNQDVSRVEPIGGGGNSRVYRVVGADGQYYALKLYFRSPSDPRDRLGTEFAAYQFLWDHGVRSVPRPLAADRQEGAAVYAYVAGRKIAAQEISTAEMDAAAEFLEQLQSLAAEPASLRFPPAAEAFFTGPELLANLQSRLDRLREPQPDASRSPALEHFLEETLLPAFQEITAWSRGHPWFGVELPRAERTLSPSDFGFHNAILRDDGRWVFLDFEYFGWDDPAKTLCDFLLHPAMRLSVACKQHFARRLLAQFGGHTAFAQRVGWVYPLFALKWCLILLNEFLPEHFRRRQFASADRGDRQAVQQDQLVKARQMLDQVYPRYEAFSYFDDIPRGLE